MTPRKAHFHCAGPHCASSSSAGRCSSSSAQKDDGCAQELSSGTSTFPLGRGCVNTDLDLPKWRARDRERSFIFCVRLKYKICDVCVCAFLFCFAGSTSLVSQT